MTTNAPLKTLIRLCAVSWLLLSFVPLPALAQLNETCVVSVLNRTVQVKPDGTWVLPNIPANFGPVRARATCTANGVTQSGQSAFFTVPTNGSVDVPQIVLGQATPTPSRVTLTAAPTTLTQAGQATQLKVTGQYADGTSKDVTAKSTGTQYLISNPALATVSADGLVTAKQSGVVVVQAIQEGTQGLLQIAVVLSQDSDGDGIPDDVERRGPQQPYRRRRQRGLQPQVLKISRQGAKKSDSRNGATTQQDTLRASRRCVRISFASLVHASGRVRRICRPRPMQSGILYGPIPPRIKAARPAAVTRP